MKTSSFLYLLPMEAQRDCGIETTLLRYRLNSYLLEHNRILLIRRKPLCSRSSTLAVVWEFYRNVAYPNFVHLLNSCLFLELPEAALLLALWKPEECKLDLEVFEIRRKLG